MTSISHAETRPALPYSGILLEDYMIYIGIKTEMAHPLLVPAIIRHTDSIRLLIV